MGSKTFSLISSVFTTTTTKIIPVDFESRQKFLSCIIIHVILYPFCFHHPFYTGKIIIERKFIDVYMCSIACRLQHLIRAATVNCILGPLMLLLRLLTWLRIWNISIIYHKTLNHFHSVVALLLVSSLETHPQSSIHARILNRCRSFGWKLESRWGTRNLRYFDKFWMDRLLWFTEMLHNRGLV